MPPISVVLAADKPRYLQGLVDFREGRENDWVRSFAVAAARAAELAAAYLVRVQQLQEEWRKELAPLGLRSDAAAWRLMEILPAHPIISQPVATEASRRSRPVVQQAIDQLVTVGVLVPLNPLGATGGGKRPGCSTSPPTSKRSTAAEPLRTVQEW